MKTPAPAQGRVAERSRHIDTDAPPHDAFAGLAPEALVRIYRTMLLSRRIETLACP